jgi:nucleoid DNA-binding protein
MGKANGGAKAASKSEVLAGLAEATGLNKKQIQSVLDALSTMIQDQLGKKGPGTFMIPGLLKLKVTRKPATKARPGKNPFTGEEIMIKAKPAKNVVRATPVKALKDMVA